VTGDREALETLSRDEYNSILRWVNQADERSSGLLVPNVVGLAEAEATNLLRAFSINDVVVTKVLSQGHAVGEVVRQNPAPGESSSWTRLDVVADPVVVPDLTGQTLRDAEGALSRMGLRRGLVDHQATGRGQVGTVSAQNPTPGTAVAPGAQVTLVLEAPPSAPKPVEPVLVTVPRLLGSSRQAAVQTLRRLKLSFVETRELSVDARTATVTAQNPDPDTRVAPGSPVTVTVLVPACTVPNLGELDPSGRKETLAAAEQIIKSARLVPNVQAIGPAGAERFAGIASQTPAAGTLVECGSTVTVQLRFVLPSVVE
jgi:beta-lactam-binding protein with PASTA domain